jgi:sugar fermentation stimulation protein A
MASCWEPGARVQLSHSDDPRRKLAWTLERVDLGGGWIGVHTHRPNQVIAEGILAGAIPELRGPGALRREVGFAPGGLPPGRIDLALGGPGSDGEGFDPRVLVEIKNVTLLVGSCLRFPDAVSARGLKHLNLLLAAVESGRRGVVLFAANRPEGDRVGPAWSIDPTYARRLSQVVEAGVEALAVRLVHTQDGIVTGPGLPVDLQPPAGWGQ